MSTFRQLREAARARGTKVGRLVSAMLADPVLQISTRRGDRHTHATTVTLRLTVECEFDIADELADDIVGRQAELGYASLARYARTHFERHFERQRLATKAGVP